MPMDAFRSLRITGLPYKAEKEEVIEELTRIFNSYGRFNVCPVLTAHDHTAFINFTFEDEAQRAYDALYNKEVIAFGQEIRIEPSFRKDRPRNFGPRDHDGPRYSSRGGYSSDASSSRDGYRDRPRYENSYNRDRDDYHNQNNYRNGGGDRGDRHYVPRRPYVPGPNPSRGGFEEDNRAPPELDPAATRCLFVGNLIKEVGDEELRDVFAKYGPVDEVDIKRHANPGTNQPSVGSSILTYAFVTFSTVDYAYKAKMGMIGRAIRGYQCRIGYGKMLQSNCLWVGNISSSVKRDALEQEFDRFGEIRTTIWPPGRNYMYMIFETQNAAIEANREMRGFQFPTTERRLRVDLVDERKAYSDEKGDTGTDHKRRHRSHRSTSESDSKRSRRTSTSVTPVDWRLPERHIIEGRTSVMTLSDECSGPCSWICSFVLKNGSFATKLCLVGGEVSVAALVSQSAGSNPLRITQRLRLEPSKLDEVTRRIHSAGNNGHCVMVAVSAAENTSSNDSSTRDPSLTARQFKNLIAYLKEKSAAGVIVLNGSTEGILHAFPPCEYAHDALQKIVPNLQLPKEGTEDDYMICIVVRGST